MFDRICRENGITHRLTKPQSPTTTGRIERFHQTLRRELLDDSAPFTDLVSAQAAVDVWLEDYKRMRPHQSLDMAVPASRFVPQPRSEPVVLPVVLPARLDLVTRAAPPDPSPPETAPVAWPLAEGEIGAIEVKRQVPASGNLSLRGQQVWFGPALAGTPVTLRIDVNRRHVLIGGARHKTLPSKLSGRDLKALLARARPAGPWPDDPGPAADSAKVVEVDRTVNAVGYVGLGGDKVLIGWPFAGQRVTLRLDGRVLQVLDEQRTLQATLPSPLPPSACSRLQGGRPAGPPLLPPPGEQIAERTASSTGGFVVAGQRIQLGRGHARQIVTAHLSEDTIRIFQGTELITTVPRVTKKVVVRKSGEHNRRKIV